MECTIEIRPHDRERGSAEMPEKLLASLRIPNGGHFALRFGGKTVDVKVKAAAGEDAILLLSREYFGSLMLPDPPTRMKVIFHEGMLHLGPVIAVLTETGKNGPSENIQAFSEELHRFVEKEGGCLYVAGLNASPGTGYRFTGTSWLKGNVPAPDIVYNRLHARQTEKSRLFQQKTADWKEKGIDVFNSNYLTKWEVYECLKANPLLQAFLPATFRYEASLLSEKLDEFGELYVKPENGSQGRGIIRLAKTKSGFLLEHNLKEDGVPIILQNMDEAAMKAEALIGRRPYMIQQGIPLVSPGGRKTDFRFLAFKSGAADWHIISAVARIAAESAMVSNLSQGGLAVKPLPLLLSNFGNKKGTFVWGLMHELAAAAAKTIDANADGHFAELGIDIGADRNGKPWIIEANIKPSKSAFGPARGIRPSVKALYHYCLFLWTERRTSHAG